VPAPAGAGERSRTSMMAARAASGEGERLAAPRSGLEQVHRRGRVESNRWFQRRAGPGWRQAVAGVHGAVAKRPTNRPSIEWLAIERLGVERQGAPTARAAHAAPAPDQSRIGSPGRAPTQRTTRSRGRSRSRRRSRSARRRIRVPPRTKVFAARQAADRPRPTPPEGAGVLAGGSPTTSPMGSAPTAARSLVATAATHPTVSGSR
jgi:hypothetical protein